ncbi:hypothetical protein [Acidianus manzaensis]|uniref:Uncharacterized protein n=1 Tax=Acidianus manzaensis TaxID=282676 RepID=A0A1W6JY64_9CREN|nr:hypothetical protein [Acidianus manzaensis]ARM75203.1 hypothetical protein B6F84_03580 [Acidianus manzaensis]
MLSRVTKLPIDDENFLKLWFENKDNVLKCMPNIKNSNENEIVIDQGFLKEKLKFKIYTVNKDKYIEHKFVGNCSLRIILLVDEADLRIIYEGDNEKNMEKVINDLIDNIKTNILNTYKLELEQKISNRNNKNLELSENLSKVSFITRLATYMKILLEEQKNINDVTEYVEDLTLRFYNYPVLYIRGSGEETFRLLLVNKELRGVYIKHSDDKVSFNEIELVKLKGEFNIRVYGGTSVSFLY